MKESSDIHLDQYNSSDDSDFDMNDDSANETESICDDQPSGVEEQYIRLYKSTDNDPLYDSSNMIMGTHVMKRMELGIPSSIMTKGKVSQNTPNCLEQQFIY